MLPLPDRKRQLKGCQGPGWQSHFIYNEGRKDLPSGEIELGEFWGTVDQDIPCLIDMSQPSTCTILTGYWTHLGLERSRARWWFDMKQLFMSMVLYRRNDSAKRTYSDSGSVLRVSIELLLSQCRHFPLQLNFMTWRRHSIRHSIIILLTFMIAALPSFG